MGVVVVLLFRATALEWLGERLRARREERLSTRGQAADEGLSMQEDGPEDSYGWQDSFVQRFSGKDGGGDADGDQDEDGWQGTAPLPSGRLCGQCGSQMLPVLYGFPSGAAVRMFEAGLVLLGGCVIDRENPGEACPACRDSWSPR